MLCNRRLFSRSAALLALVLALSACGLFSGGGGRQVRVSGNIEVADVEAGFKMQGKVAERLASAARADSERVGLTLVSSWKCQCHS